jgi:hypothetical protein
MNIMQTKLSNAEDELHRLSAGELDYNTARQRQESDMQKCKQAINEAEIQRQNDHARHMDSTMGAKKQAELDQQIALTIAKRQAKLEKDAAVGANTRVWASKYKNANADSTAQIKTLKRAVTADDKLVLALEQKASTALELLDSTSAATAASAMKADNVIHGEDGNSTQGTDYAKVVQEGVYQATASQVAGRAADVDDCIAASSNDGAPACKNLFQQK